MMWHKMRKTLSSILVLAMVLQLGAPVYAIPGVPAAIAVLDAARRK